MRGSHPPPVVLEQPAFLAPDQNVWAEAARHSQEVEGLLTAAARLNAAVEPEEVFLGVAGIAAELLAVRFASIVTNEGDYALSRYRWTDGVWHSTARRLPLDGSASGWVITHAQPIRSTDVTGDGVRGILPTGEPLPRIGPAPDAKPSPRRSLLSVPILARGGNVLAALHLYDRCDGQPFSEQDQRLVEGIAHHAAVALERATFTNRLQQSEERFRSLVQHASDMIAVIDADGVLQYVSPATKRLLGYLPDVMLGTVAASWVHPDDAEAFSASLDRLSARDQPPASLALEFRMRHQDGSWRFFEATVTDLLNEPSVGGFVLNARDSTERKAFEEQLTRQAFFDALTNLCNRRRFLDRLGHALSGAGRRASNVAVLFLDLDGFKLVNDSLGHPVGDELLVAVGERLMECQRADDTVARFGGDEFAILLENVAEPADAVVAAERILAHLHRPFTVKRRQLAISASIGIAISAGTAQQSPPEDLLRHADIALYQAKVTGKARAVVFSPVMSTRAIERLGLESDLRQAVERRELRLFYQPVVDLGTGSIVAVEALVRWKHPRRGLLLPDVFIPLAEETGLILSIGRWVLEEACTQARTWQRLRRDGPPLVMSVNVSARQLEQPDFVEQVQQVLLQTGLEPNDLELELTESMLIQEPDVAIARLAALKKLGIRLAIDDFGTGYSSLSYLQRMVVDTLKVDRSFVRELGSGASSSAIVQMVAGLAHARGMRVTAEGIETAEQLAQVQASQCDRGQGFYIARPLSRRDAGVAIAQGLTPPTAEEK